jgi:predicted GIY-YIG superfamily endonuclease
LNGPPLWGNLRSCSRIAFRPQRAEAGKHVAHDFTYTARRTDPIRTALQREKNLKHWSRAWKVKLIRQENPNWDDFYDQLA